MSFVHCKLRYTMVEQGYPKEALCATFVSLRITGCGAVSLDIGHRQICHLVHCRPPLFGRFTIDSGFHDKPRHGVAQWTMAATAWE